MALRILDVTSVVAIAFTTALTGGPSAASQATDSEVMQSVFGNRLRGSGVWRQDNAAFESGADAPAYWIQVWRNGPGEEVVIVDAYAVSEGDVCSPLMHIVYTYDAETGRIRSDAFGANGVRGHGMAEFDGSTTTSEITVQTPGGELRMRDRQDHGAGDVVVVDSERWDGAQWVPGEPATWRRSTPGFPCPSLEH